MKVNKTGSIDPNPNGNPVNRVRKGNLRSRSVEVLGNHDNASSNPQRVENVAAKRKGVENDSGSKRQRRIKITNMQDFDTSEKQAEYHAQGVELSRKIFNLSPARQKAKLEFEAEKNPYAAYLLADILLRDEPSVEDIAKGISLLKKFLKEMNDKFGEINSEWELFDEYAYTHFLLGVHLDKVQKGDEVKHHLLIASKHKDHSCDAGLLYGNQLERNEDDLEPAIAHWRNMLNTFLPLKDNEEFLGVIYNRLGCALVWGGNPTLAHLEEAVIAFKKGMECGNDVAEENWEKYNPLLPVDIEKYIEDHPSVSEASVAKQEGSDEERNLGLDDLCHAAADLPRIDEHAEQNGPDVTHEAPPAQQEGQPSHVDQILDSLKEAASYGNMEALKLLATILTEGKGPIAPNPLQALPYWEELANQGQNGAYIKQIDIIAKNQPDCLEKFDRIISLARRLKEVNAELMEFANGALSIFLYKKALIHLEAEAAMPNHAEEIIACLKEAASYRSVEALHLLATILTEGKGPVQPNLEQALPYWVELAAKGQPEAYLKQIDILVKTQPDNLELYLKVIGLARSLKEHAEYEVKAKNILATYLFKQAQVFLNI